jgi:Tol biopolymer transport system component
VCFNQTRHWSRRGTYLSYRTYRVRSKHDTDSSREKQGWRLGTNTLHTVSDDGSPDNGCDR